MGLTNLFNSNLIVTIGLTVLLSSVIVYYCNSRFVTLEKGIHRQNQVLAEFIANVQGELRNGNQLPYLTPEMPSTMVNIASTEAIKSAEKYYAESNNKVIKTEKPIKIEVSDDESDSDDDTTSNDTCDSDNDSDCESVAEESTATQMTNLMKLVPLNNMMDIKVIAMSSESNFDFGDISQIIEKSTNNTNVYNSIVEVMPDAIMPDAIMPDAIMPDAITEVNDLEVLSYDSDDDTTDDEKSNSNDTEIVNVIKKDAFEVLTAFPDVDYKKMNVPELRELMVERGLTSGSSYKKMKKNELIDALSK